MRGNLQRLPKWAHEEILRLDRELQYWKDRVAGISRGDGGIVIAPHSDAPVTFGDTETVRFMTPSGWLEVSIEKSGISVYAREGKFANDAINVVPQAANVVHLRLGPYR